MTYDISLEIGHGPEVDWWFGDGMIRTSTSNLRFKETGNSKHFKDRMIESTHIGVS